MGQSPSAIASREDDDDEDLLCSGGGCLPVPRFFRRWEGHRRVTVFEDYYVGDGTELTATVEEPPPPEDLVLTDVEDEEEGSDDGDENRRSPKGGGAIAEDGTELTTTVDEPPPSEDLILTDVEDGKEENDSSEETTIPEDVLSRIVAVDCGMVLNGDKVKKQELRRVSVVNGYGEPLLSALVRVDAPPSAGYLSSLLPQERRINGYGDDFDVGVPAPEIREEVSCLLRGKIVVGHSVEGDLAVLGLGQCSLAMGEGRDFEVRDTATYAPFMRQNHSQGQRDKRKLRDLVRERLKKEIQPSGQFHCCEEDAIAALDLYKSVWHEWESVSTKQANKVTSAAAKPSKEKQQTGNSPNGQRSKVSQKKKRETKKQKRKSEKREWQRLKKKIQLQNSINNNRLVKYDSCCLSSAHRLLVSSLSALFVFPTQLMIHGITRPVTVSTAPKQRRRKDSKKKKSLLKKHHCDSLLLLCHCLLEAWCIILPCVGCAPPAHWNVTSLHGANGALTVGLVGMKLFRRRHRNDKGSGFLFGILAQYRIISALVRMAGCYGMVNVATMPVVQEHTHVIERLASALARQIMFATPMAFTVQKHVGQAAAIDNGGLFLEHFLPFIQTGATKFKHMGGVSSQEWLPLACDVALSCWFSLRAAKKI